MQNISFKWFLLASVFVFLFISCRGTNEMNGSSLDTMRIKSLIAEGSLLNGAIIPEDITARIGASHVAGKYYLTNQPYLLEGAKAIQNLGMEVIKIWFQESTTLDYSYHSNWQIDPRISLVEMAKHRYYKELFDMPFKTFALSVRNEVNLNQAIEGGEVDFQKEESAMYEFAKYLLVNYQHRDIEFVLHNWEGDWLMRGGTNEDAQWTKESIPTDIENRIQVMTKWFQARQAGVDRARKEIGKTACKVYHAIEVNKVLDGMNGIPTLTSDVLPNVKTDLVSWSCYEGLSDPLYLWQGIDFIKDNLKSTGEFSKMPIMIGEIGIPENEGSVFGIQSQNGIINKQDLIERWDQAMSVFIYKNIPYIIHWQIYCNEIKKGEPQSTVYTNDQLRGFWLIRPDGTKSHSAEYLTQIMHNAGKSIKNISK